LPPAVGVVAALAGSALAAPLGVGLLNLGIGLSAGAGILAGQIGGFVVSTAISQVGSRLFTKHPKAPDFSGEASGRTVTIRSSVESHKVIYGQAKVSGPLAFVKTVDFGNNNLGVQNGAPGGNGFLHMVIPLAGHEVEEIGTLYLNDRPCTLDAAGFVNEEPYNYNDGNGLKFVRVKKHLGSVDQEADPDLIAECGLTTAHRLRGIAYAYIRFHWNPNVFPLGIPNVSFVVKGKKVYDPRTTLTLWSDNAALCVRDYLASSYGFACDDDEINDTYFTAAANACDEDVALTTGGTQKRYTCNGVIDTAVAPLDNLGSLVSSVAGAVTYVQGQFRVHAGTYDSPAGDITADMLAGPVRAELRTPRKELFNAVKGTYVDPNKQWQPTDFPFVTNATYETQDGGERIYKDVDLPFTNHPEAAQRIAKILLEKARQGIKLELTLNHSALKFAVYDTVTYTDAQFGWSSKVFRVMKVGTTGVGAITLSLQEESSASYDWNSGEATAVDAAPDTNLPDPFTVQPPGSPVVREVLYAPLDGNAVRSKATVTWPESPDVFAREYQLEYKLTSDAAYTVLPRTSTTSLEVLDLEQGVYNFRVKTINRLGVSSAYAATVAELAGLTAPPEALTNFSLNAIHNNAHLSWDQSPDLDVRNGGKIRLRYTPELASPSWSSAVDLGPALPGVATQAVAPLLDGTYLIKAVDSSGNESVSAAVIKSTVANVVKMNRVAVSQQDPDFTGHIIGVTAHKLLILLDGALQLNSTLNFDQGGLDGLINFDAIEGFFDSCTFGFEKTGLYYFGDGSSASIDLMKVTTSRVTAAIDAEVYDPTNTFDQAFGDFDDRMGQFDGDDVTGIDAWLEVSTSDDGSTWSDFRRFFVGDYTCRAYIFRLFVQSTEPGQNSLNIAIRGLSVTVDVPDVLDSDTLTTSASGVTPITFTKTFVVVPDIGMTIQGASVGDQEIIQNVTEDGFDIGVKNSGGSFVARDVSWSASGY
jgi:hypothetical protein